MSRRREQARRSYLSGPTGPNWKRPCAVPGWQNGHHSSPTWRDVAFFSSPARSPKTYHPSVHAALAASLTCRRMWIGRCDRLPAATEIGSRTATGAHPAWSLPLASSALPQPAMEASGSALGAFASSRSRSAQSRMAAEFRRAGRLCRTARRVRLGRLARYRTAAVLL